MPKKLILEKELKSGKKYIGNFHHVNKVLTTPPSSQTRALTPQHYYIRMYID